MRRFLFLLACLTVSAQERAPLWKLPTGELVSSSIAWAKAPAVSTSADTSLIFLDATKMGPQLLVVVEGQSAMSFTAGDLLRLTRLLREAKKTTLAKY